MQHGLYEESSSLKVMLTSFINEEKDFRYDQVTFD